MMLPIVVTLVSKVGQHTILREISSFVVDSPDIARPMVRIMSGTPPIPHRVFLDSLDTIAIDVEPAADAEQEKA